MGVLSKVIKPSGFSTSAISQDVLTTVASSPVANLRQATSEMRENLHSRQDSYDSLGSSFANIPEIYEHTEESLNHKLEYLDDPWKYEELVEISEQSAKQLASGVCQSASHAKNDGIAISDESGTVYHIKPDIGETAIENFENLTIVPDVVYVTQGGEVPLLKKINGKFFLNMRAVPVNADLREKTGPRLMDAAVDLCSIIEGHSYGDLATCVLKVYQYMIPSGSAFTIYQQLGELMDFYHLEKSVNTIQFFLFSLLNNAMTKLSNISPLLYVGKSVITASEINAAYAELCDVALSSNPSSFFSSLMASVANRSKAAAGVIGRAWRHFCQGGLRGLVKFIIAFFKGGSSIANEDGTLKFTNNEGLLPSEFIAGLVGTVLSALVSIVGIIVSLFSKVLGAIFVAVGAILGTIFSSVKSVANDIFASVNTNFDDSMLVVPAHPFAPFAYLVTDDPTYGNHDLFEFCRRQFMVNFSICSVQVPGGILIIGPGSFIGEGESIDSWRIEFHPSAISFPALDPEHADHDQLITALRPYHYELGPTDIHRNIWPTSSNAFPVKGSDSAQGPNVRIAYPYSFHASLENQRISAFWKDLCEHYSVPLQNSDTGYLSEKDDYISRLSIQFSVGWFLLWLSSWEIRNEDLMPNSYVPIITDQIEFDKDSEEPEQAASSFLTASLYTACGANAYGYSDLAGPFACSWKQMIAASTYTNQVAEGRESTSQFRLKLYDITAWITDDPPGFSVILKYTSPERYFTLPQKVITKYDYENYFCNSNAVSLNSDFVYDTVMPKYNSSSFWKWTSLALAVTTITAVTTVVASVKFKMWSKNKRARNKAAFDAAQADYNNALQGTRTVVKTNEDGEKYEEEIKFDTSTPEGQAEVKAAWKAYKKTARTNNLWQKIIGGSRYDVSTFWGEADAPEEDSGDGLSFSDKLSDLSGEEELNEGITQQASDATTISTSEEITSVDDANSYDIITLIKGPLLEPSN